MLVWCEIGASMASPVSTRAAGLQAGQPSFNGMPQSRCAGDCNGDGSVSVDELVAAGRIALGHVAAEACQASDPNGDGIVSIDELQAAINAALDGCHAPPPTATPHVRITAPAHGTFTLDPSTAVNGQITNPAAGQVLTVNGNPVTVQADGTFSTSVSLDPDAIFNPVLAELTVPATGFTARDRVVVIAGDSVADGAFSPHSLGLRINDSGFDQLEPTFPMLLNIDLETLIAPGTRVISGYCAIDSIFGCLQRVDVVARSATVDSSALNLDAMAGFVAADVTLSGVRVSVNVHGGAIDCTVDFVASTATILGAYDLLPLAGDPQQVDVNQRGDVTVVLTNFDYTFTSGVCNFPVVDDLLHAVIGDIGPAVHDGLITYLQDPDDPGPQDAPIAAAMQSALAGVAIGGPVGQALGVDVELPLFGITEDPMGVTFGSDARITALNKAPGAPLLTASYSVASPFPTLGPTTPLQGVPYDLGLCVSTSAINQLLKAEVQSGLLAFDVTQVDVGGGMVPLTAAVLTLFVPEFGTLDPQLPLTLRVRPTLAPVVTGNPGPNGELAGLQIGQLLIDVVSGAADSATVYLRTAVDLRAGLGVTFDASNNRLVFALGRPLAGDIALTVLDNPIGANEARVQAAVPRILAQYLPELGGALGGVPIPQLLGLQAQGVEISRIEQFICVYLDLRAAPNT